MDFFFYIVFVGPLAVCVAVYANHKKRSGIIWFLLSILITSPLAFLILLIIGSPAITKSRLIVLVCVICLVVGWFYYLIIQQKQQGVKSKMTEVTRWMEYVASAVTAYNQDLNSFPYCDNIVAIRTSLGVSISTDRISSMTVTSPRAEEVIITATIKGIHSRVDGNSLALTGKPSERGILWVWGGTVPSTYVPRVPSSYFPTNKNN